MRCKWLQFARARGAGAQACRDQRCAWIKGAGISTRRGEAEGGGCMKGRLRRRNRGSVLGVQLQAVVADVPGQLAVTRTVKRNEKWAEMGARWAVYKAGAGRYCGRYKRGNCKNARGLGRGGLQGRQETLLKLNGCGVACGGSLCRLTISRRGGATTARSTPLCRAPQLTPAAARRAWGAGSRPRRRARPAGCVPPCSVCRRPPPPPHGRAAAGRREGEEVEGGQSGCSKLCTAGRARRLEAAPVEDWCSGTRFLSLSAQRGAKCQPSLRPRRQHALAWCEWKATSKAPGLRHSGNCVAYMTAPA